MPCAKHNSVRNYTNYISLKVLKSSDIEGRGGVIRLAKLRYNKGNVDAGAVINLAKNAYLLLV